MAETTDERFRRLCREISDAADRVRKCENDLRDAHCDVHRLLMEKAALMRVRKD